MTDKRIEQTKLWFREGDAVPLPYRKRKAQRGSKLRKASLRVGGQCQRTKNLFDVYYFESADSINSVYPAAPFAVLKTVSVQF
ncbi:hypothetical protein [uncultured Nostoc sp.]|uniref:hypothetical protein n=1 Tax=uncultured Nostoc sp. TaxID=340711 RepID=UPI0035CC3204